jgi:hypothetical protein
VEEQQEPDPEEQAEEPENDDDRYAGENDRNCTLSRQTVLIPFTIHCPD